MRFLAALAVLALAGCAAAPTPAPTLSFTAFTGAWSDPAVMDASAETISVLAVDGLNVLPGGSGLTSIGPEAAELLHHAHSLGIPAELMVGNFSSELDDFDEQLAYDTLSSPSARSAAITRIGEIVTTDGWDGVSIDFESLTARDTEGLTAFARELREEVGPEKTISIALMVGGASEAGYDLVALASTIDRFLLMAYDEHGPWEPDAPGPIGSLDWQRDALDALLTSVPADRIELGVAGYGYAWGPSTTGGQLSVDDARALAGDAAVFDDAAGEWTATLDDGTVVWWSDIRSLRLRVDVARNAGIAGLALWSLEQGDPVSPADLEEADLR